MELPIRIGSSILKSEKNQFGPFPGIAPETQAFPDAPNQVRFDHDLIQPDEAYRHQSTYKFYFYTIIP